MHQVHPSSWPFTGAFSFKHKTHRYAVTRHVSSRLVIRNRLQVLSWLTLCEPLSGASATVQVEANRKGWKGFQGFEET